MTNATMTQAVAGRQGRDENAPASWSDPMDRLLEDMNIPHEHNVALAPRTWYGVGGPARVLARPSSVQQLSALAARAHEQRVPVYVLGSGANLLVSDAGVDGLVIELTDPCFKSVKIDGSLVSAGAGYELEKLVLKSAKAGLRGLEVMAGIPASVGGAVRMNAGGAFGEIGRCVRRVQVMDLSGQVYYRDRDDLVFTYRRSNITARFILEVEFELTSDDPEALMRRVKEIFAYKSSVQPMGANSAGCAFKNPVDANGAWLEENGQRQSAGRLIDRAGLKGFRIGGAEVSPQHGNFVVAHAGCKAADILAVIAHAQQVVKEKFGVELEREIVVW